MRKNQVRLKKIEMYMILSGALQIYNRIRNPIIKLHEKPQL